MPTVKKSGGIKWRLAFFMTGGARKGDTGLVDGDYSRYLRVSSRGTPVHFYHSFASALAAAEAVNGRHQNFMCWPVTVSGSYPWNPVSP